MKCSLTFEQVDPWRRTGSNSAYNSTGIGQSRIEASTGFSLLLSLVFLKHSLVDGIVLLLSGGPLNLASPSLAPWTELHNMRVNLAAYVVR